MQPAPRAMWREGVHETQICQRKMVSDCGCGNGRFFIYSAVDEAENKSLLYLWQPGSDALALLHTVEGTDSFRNFAWLPDSTGVYFNLGRMELWKFEVETESITLIASSEEN